jgi:hypothetical protein
VIKTFQDLDFEGKVVQVIVLQQHKLQDARKRPDILLSKLAEILHMAFGEQVHLIGIPGIEGQNGQEPTVLPNDPPSAGIIFTVWPPRPATVNCGQPEKF